MSVGWFMEGADPRRSRRVAVAGPRRGRVMWSLDLDQPFDDPVVLPDGTIVAAFSIWAKRAALAVIDGAGKLMREVPPYRPDWSWRSPVATPDGRIMSIARDHLFEFSPGGEPELAGRLADAPARMSGTPDGGLCMHSSRSGFMVTHGDGKSRWSSAGPGESAWREGTWAFDRGGILYTAEQDTWRSEGDAAEQFSRVGAYAAQGRQLWRHVLTAKNAYDNPVNEVRAIWGREDDAVYFGSPLIQCYGAKGEERWRIDSAKDVADRAAVKGTHLELARDGRLSDAPYVVKFDRGMHEYLACTMDADGGIYLCDRSHVFALDGGFALRWQLPLGDGYLAPPVLSPLGYLLVAGGTKLYAIG